MADPERNTTQLPIGQPSDGGVPSLRRVLDDAARFFWCNTNRNADDGGTFLEQQMHSRRFAAAWQAFNYEAHMRRVRRGDVIFMYAKGCGIIGIGVARESRVEIVGPDHPDRLRPFHHGEHEEELRVPVEWVVWDEENPCPVEALLPSFQEITEHQDRIDAVRSHFLNDAV